MTTITGFGRLVRFIVRRDRVRLGVWIVGIAAVVLGSSSSLQGLYPDQQAIDDYVRLFGDNPALVAFAGPGYGFDDPNVGVVLVNEAQLWSCLAAALMSIFLLNRSTRAEEDSERVDLVRASVVGRHAPTAAAVAVVAAADLLLATICTVGFVGLGYPVVGSVALGASIAAAGLAFVGVTAVTAQLASGGRACLGMAGAVLGAAFVVRAVGDIAGNWVRWASPIGWAQGVRAFAGERWWPIGLCVVFAATLVVAAFWLSTRRDLGSGIVATRAGDQRAAPWMTRPVGLALRLQRGTLIGWTVGVLLTGLVYGSIGDDVGEMIEDNSTFEDFLAQTSGSSITDSFFATSMSQIALLAAGYAISAVLRPRSEEVAGHAEQVLATPTSRERWFGSHLVVAALGTVVVLAAGGLGVGVAYAAVSGETAEIPRLLGAALTRLPAVYLLAGLVVALFGRSVRLALLGWAGLAISVLVELFGGILQLPDAVTWLSPLHHVPGVPAQELSAGPLVALLAVATVLTALGVRALRHRDLAAA